MGKENHQQELNAYYDSLYEKHGASVESLGWSAESQLIRFGVI